MSDPYVSESHTQGYPRKVEVRPEGAREGDVPYYARWSDGSEYQAVELPNGFRFRRYHGPMFGRAIDNWKEETF